MARLNPWPRRWTLAVLILVAIPCWGEEVVLSLEGVEAQEALYRRIFGARLSMTGHRLLPGGEAPFRLTLALQGEGLLVTVEGQGCLQQEPVEAGEAAQRARMAALVALRLLEACQSEARVLATTHVSRRPWVLLATSAVGLTRPGDLSGWRWGGRLEATVLLAPRWGLGLDILISQPLSTALQHGEVSRLDLPMALYGRFRQCWKPLALSLDGGLLFNGDHWAFEPVGGERQGEWGVEVGLKVHGELALHLTTFLYLAAHLELAVLFSDRAFVPHPEEEMILLSPVLFSVGLGLGWAL